MIAAGIVMFGGGLRAEPPVKPTKPTPALARVIESANGWTCVNGQWVHRDGYKFVNNRIVRTTARPGQPAPKPPGKLALENPAMLAPRTKAAAADARTAAEKAAEQREKNLAPRPAPQTGSHL